MKTKGLFFSPGYGKEGQYRILSAAGQSIYYPGEEGIERYRFELRHRIEELKKTDADEIWNIFNSGKLESSEEAEETKKDVIKSEESNLERTYRPDFAIRFIEDQIKSLVELIEDECLIPLLYLLKLGYPTVSSNAYGHFYKGISFFHHKFVTPTLTSIISMEPRPISYFLAIEDNRLLNTELADRERALLENMKPLEANRTYEGVPMPVAYKDVFSENYPEPIKLSDEELRDRGMVFDFTLLPSLPKSMSKEKAIRQVVSMLDEKTAIKQSIPRPSTGSIF